MSRQPTVPKRFEYFLKRKEDYNIIFPSEKGLNVSLLHKLIPELSRLWADPEDGEDWNVGLDHENRCPETEIFSFSKRGLQRIAQAAASPSTPSTHAALMMPEIPAALSTRPQARSKNRTAAGTRSRIPRRLIWTW